MEQLLAVVIGFFLGATAGASSSILGWLKSGEGFEIRKFINGIVTGVITGIVAILAATTAIQEAASQDTVLLVLYVTTFVGIIGIDAVRTSVTGAIRTEAGNV